MDWLTFVAAIVKSVAWPVTLVLILLVFRRPVRELIPRLRTIRIGSVEASVAREYHDEVGESVDANAERQRRVRENFRRTRPADAAERDRDEPSGN